MKESKSFLLDEWEYNRSAFTVSKKQNELIYVAGEKAYEADRVRDSLPDILEARRSGVQVIMKLDEAENFCKISFEF